MGAVFHRTVGQDGKESGEEDGQGAPG